MVLRHVQKVSKEEFLYQLDDYALAEAHTTYGRMGIKVWIMKGEVYGKRSFSACWNGQETIWRKRWRFSSWESNFNKGGKPDARKKEIILN
jgi:small subunit ribosomal protein S3